MALGASANLIGALLATAAGSTDNAGRAAWGVGGGGIAGVLANWIPGNALANALGPTPLTAAGAAVSGQGSFQFLGTATDLGPLLAAAAGSKDAAGIARWQAIAGALLNHWTTYGQINPTGLIANPSGGAVSGACTILFSNLAVGPALADAAGSTDTPGRLNWTLLGLQLMTFIQTNAVVSPLGVPPMSSPNGGGPVAGMGLVV